MRTDRLKVTGTLETQGEHNFVTLQWNDSPTHRSKYRIIYLDETALIEGMVIFGDRDDFLELKEIAGLFKDSGVQKLLVMSYQHWNSKKVPYIVNLKDWIK